MLKKDFCRQDRRWDLWSLRRIADSNNNAEATNATPLPVLSFWSVFIPSLCCFFFFFFLSSGVCHYLSPSSLTSTSLPVFYCNYSRQRGGDSDRLCVCSVSSASRKVKRHRSLEDLQSANGTQGQTKQWNGRIRKPRERFSRRLFP